MKINGITTIVDLSLNLSGSLAGIPALLNQLPAGPRLGLDDYPEVWEDVDDIGQTWTPNLADRELELTTRVLNPQGVAKAPFSSNIPMLSEAAEWGSRFEQMLLGKARNISELQIGEDIGGALVFVYPLRKSGVVVDAQVVPNNSFFVRCRRPNIGSSQVIKYVNSTGGADPVLVETSENVFTSLVAAYPNRDGYTEYTNVALRLVDRPLIVSNLNLPDYDNDCLGWKDVYIIMK